MKENEKREISEHYITGIILSVVGGFLDAYTYIARGGVFANAQTGNIVLFGIECAHKEWKNAIYYLFPIGAFIVGIMLAAIIKTKYKNSKNLHWRQIVIAMEILVLIAVAFIPEGRSYNGIATILISFVCSLQVEGFRVVNGLPIETTMCTGNLRSATDQLFNFFLTKNKTSIISSIQYFGIIIFFVIGAILGTTLTNIFSLKTVLFSCIGLLIVLLMMFKKR